MSEIQFNVEDLTTSSGLAVKAVSFVGSLDESNVDEKSAVVYDLISALPQGAQVLFDFAGLDYMNSKSIGYLTDWYLKIADEKGGALVLAQTQPGVVDVLQTIGILDFVKNFPDRDTALAELSSGGGGLNESNPS